MILLLPCLTLDMGCMIKIIENITLLLEYLYDLLPIWFYISIKFPRNKPMSSLTKKQKRKESANEKGKKKLQCSVSVVTFLLSKSIYI